MVEKFMNQGANKAILVENKAEAENRLEDVIKARQEAQAKVSELILSQMNCAIDAHARL